MLMKMRVLALLPLLAAGALLTPLSRAASTYFLGFCNKVARSQIPCEGLRCHRR